MVRRVLSRLLRARLAAWPAAALVGARQVGKTTLARSLGGLYFDMERPADRTRLDVTWDEVVAGRRLIVLDEAQAWPELFARLRGAIDDDRARKRRFLLLGSVSPGLMRDVSESLAGRLALCELTPLLATELPAARESRLWLAGGYPDGGVLGGEGFSSWQDDYLTILAERDLPSWGLPAAPQVTRRLFRMLAAAHGGIWNASQIGSSLGLSHHTVNSYLDFLEGAFLVRRLQPLHRNLEKRLVKSPKLFWRDSGLLHALQGVRDFDHLLAQPWVGASWEGFVIEQALACLGARGVRGTPYFLRTSDGYEIDLVLELGRELWAIEVKLTSSPAPEDLRRLRKTAEWIGATRVVLVSRVRRTAESARAVSTNLRGLLSLLARGAT